MIVRYPQISEGGRPIEGAEVTFRFDKIIMIKHMVKYNYERMDDDNNNHRVEIIPNCCVITLQGDCEFCIEADYNELSARLIDLNPQLNVETL